MSKSAKPKERSGSNIMMAVLLGLGAGVLGSVLLDIITALGWVNLGGDGSFLHEVAQWTLILILGIGGYLLIRRYGYRRETGTGEEHASDVGSESSPTS